MRIGITGASGFLGGALVAEAQQRNHIVVPIQLPRTDDLRQSSILESILSSAHCDVIIHTAVARHPITVIEHYLNAELPSALERVFHSVNQKGVFVHISSIGVVVKSLQDTYITSKREAELRLVGSRSLIIRPNLIWSRYAKGDAGRLQEFLLRYPISFMVFPGNKYLPVLDIKLAKEILSLIVQGKQVFGVIDIMGDKPYTVWKLAKYVAKEHNRKLFPIPIPWSLPFLPSVLRNTDCTVFNNNWKPKSDRRIVIPFSLGDLCR